MILRISHRQIFRNAKKRFSDFCLFYIPLNLVVLAQVRDKCVNINYTCEILEIYL